MLLGFINLVGYLFVFKKNKILFYFRTDMKVNEQIQIKGQRRVLQLMCGQ